jgi:uncharacterized FAD-dependent dehydrogenase
LLVDARLSDFASEDAFAGFDFREIYEKAAFRLSGKSHRPPAETLAAFAGSDSALASCLPDFALNEIREGLPTLGKKLKGFDSSETKFYAVETRSSSPARILRNEDLSTNIKGIYPGGEGAGHAGGIMSASVDGVRIAEVIMQKGVLR